jgi:hypothetical protein
VYNIIVEDIMSSNGTKEQVNTAVKESIQDMVNSFLNNKTEGWPVDLNEVIARPNGNPYQRATRQYQRTPLTKEVARTLTPVLNDLHDTDLELQTEMLKFLKEYKAPVVEKEDMTIGMAIEIALDEVPTVKGIQLRLGYSVHNKLTEGGTQVFDSEERAFILLALQECPKDKLRNACKYKVSGLLDPLGDLLKNN